MNMNAKNTLRTATVATCLLALAGTLIGCSKVAEAVGGSVDASGPVLVANAAGPAGYTWQATQIPSVGAYELPSGGKWQKEGLGASNEEQDFTIMVQVQGGVEPSDRATFVKGVIDANKRDAPKYELLGQQEGQVNKTSTGRIDGKFDNGTAYATRDYIIIRNHMAVAVMVRGPLAKQSEVQAVADHVAASLK